MTKRCTQLAGLFLALAGAAGCGQTSPTPVGDTNGNNKIPAKTVSYLVSAEPSGAKGVIDLRKEAKDGDAVVVVGRIGGSKQPLTKDRAAFTIVDLSFTPCEDDTPWVYCCTPREELLQGMVYVKFVDGQGKTLAQDARQLLNVKELDTVVVRGHARRDEAGNLTAVVADAIHVRK